MTTEKVTPPEIAEEAKKEPKKGKLRTLKNNVAGLVARTVFNAESVNPTGEPKLIGTAIAISLATEAAQKAKAKFTAKKQEK
jgi:hypothetical protein